MEIGRIIIGLIYTALGILLLPIAILLFLIFPRGRAHFSERIWGQFPNSFILIHGASYGEVIGLLPLARALRDNKESEIVISSTSSTGRKAGVDAGFTSRLLPFDCLPLYFLAFRHGNPKLVIISETEIWPGLIFYLSLCKIPWVLVNARISDASWPWYRLASILLAPFLVGASKVLTADNVSIERFKKLGVSTERIKEVGNSKYDSLPKPLIESEKRDLQTSLFKSEAPILVLGSIRPGEEKVWFPAIRKVFENRGRLNIVVAPRHPEKFDYFADILRNEKIPFTRRSSRIVSSDPVMLLNSLGELSKIYGAGTLAFIGGSIEPFGGHNPLEAMVQGTAICIGPSTFVVREIITALQQHNGVIEIKNQEDAFNVIELILNEPDTILEKGRIAKEVSSRFVGATARIINEL